MQKSIERTFYFPICTESEIDRILNNKNAKDYLLSLRANTVVDNMRLYRVYRNYAIMNENKDWKFEESFDESHYILFKELLTKDEVEKCRHITYGDIFTNDPNGHIFNTDHGVIITISTALDYFLKYIHLALLDFDDRVPFHVKLNSLRIALRVMLKTETLDFLMDPRGIIPKDIYLAINDPIKYQKLFIAGHEFAHSLLGHLNEKDLINKNLFFSIDESDKPYHEISVYNQSQKNEFEADLFAIKKCEQMEEEYYNLFSSVLVWFAGLELFEALCEGMCPRFPWDIKTHPSAKQRYFNIIENSNLPSGFIKEDWINFWIYVENLKGLVLEDLSYNFELYEMYGSCYLDKPNSEWRGKELIDRVDYY